MTITVETKQAEAEKELEFITLAPFYPHIEVEAKSKKVFDTYKNEFIETFVDNYRTYCKLMTVKTIPYFNTTENGDKQFETYNTEKIVTINLTNAIKYKLEKYKFEFENVNGSNRFLKYNNKLFDLETFELKNLDKNNFTMFNLYHLQNCNYTYAKLHDKVFEDYIATSKGKILRKIDTLCYEVRQTKNKLYPTVTLSHRDEYGNSTQTTFDLHYIIAYSLKYDEYLKVKYNYPNDEIEIDHIDSNPQNPNIENLQFLPKNIHEEITQIRRRARRDNLDIIELEKYHKGFRVY